MRPGGVHRVLKKSGGGVHCLPPSAAQPHYQDIPGLDFTTVFDVIPRKFSQMLMKENDRAGMGKGGSGPTSPPGGWGGSLRFKNTGRGGCRSTPPPDYSPGLVFCIHSWDISCRVSDGAGKFRACSHPWQVKRFRPNGGGFQSNPPPRGVGGVAGLPPSPCATTPPDIPGLDFTTLLDGKPGDFLEPLRR
jgi:hypothetical protein